MSPASLKKISTSLEKRLATISSLCNHYTVTVANNTPHRTNTMPRRKDAITPAAPPSSTAWAEALTAAKQALLSTLDTGESLAFTLPHSGITMHETGDAIHGYAIRPPSKDGLLLLVIPGRGAIELTERDLDPTVLAASPLSVVGRGGFLDIFVARRIANLIRLVAEEWRCCSADAATLEAQPKESKPEKPKKTKTSGTVRRKA